MTQDTETKVDKVFKNSKSMAELQYDLQIKRFYVGNVLCYPASFTSDVIATMKKDWSEYAIKEYNRGLVDGKNWWKIWRKWK